MRRFIEDPWCEVHDIKTPEGVDEKSFRAGVRAACNVVAMCPSVSADTIVHCANCEKHFNCYVEQHFNKCAIDPRDGYCAMGKRKKVKANE